MLTSAWKTAVIASAGTVSAEVDLGSTFENVMVLIPTIDSATISLSISNVSGGTFFPLHEWNDADADGTVLKATTAGTGGISAVFSGVGAQFLKVVAGAAQNGGARSILVRGF